MVKKNYRLQLAKMLKLYKEMNTDNGVLVAEAEEIEVGTEVFIETEEGMTPAADGEYTDTVENKIYVVSGGTITEIKEKETTMETSSGNGEEGNQEGAQEQNMEDNKGSDNGNDANNESNETGSTSEMETENEALKAENESLKAKVAELEATVSDLEDQVAAYKAKEEETEPSAEDAEKFSKQTPENKALSKKLAAAKAILNAVK